MLPDTLRFLLKDCGEGTCIEVEYRTNTESVHREGSLLRYDAEGLLFEADGHWEYVICSALMRLRVQRKIPPAADPPAAVDAVTPLPEQANASTPTPAPPPVASVAQFRPTPGTILRRSASEATVALTQVSSAPIRPAGPQTQRPQPGSPTAKNSPGPTPASNPSHPRNPAKVPASAPITPSPPTSPLSDSPTNPVSAQGHSKGSAHLGLPSAEAGLLFTGRIVIELPEPNFAVEGLSAKDQQDFVRCKNIYDYAVKVGEIARIRDTIPTLANLASSARNRKLFTLAGLFCLKLQQHGQAREYLEYADELDDPSAARALAWIAADAEDWRGTAEKLTRALLLEAQLTVNDQDTLINLGRCLSRLQDRELAGLALLAQKASSSPLAELARIVAAFSLQSTNPAAAEQLRTGNLDQARSLAADSSIFRTIDNLREKLAVLEASHRSGLSDSSRSSTGHITAYYPAGRFGFVFDEVNQQTYHFSLDTVEDVNLTNQLSSNRTGQKVLFRPSPNTLPGAKYATLEFLVPADSPAAPVAVAPARVESNPTLAARLAVVPKGAGPYARAKKEEVLGHLDIAEKLLREEIASKGQYRNSATMDLAALLSRLDRPNEAIDVLNAHRREVADPRPVDNHLASILLRAMKYREAAVLFHRLQAGVDNRTKQTLRRQEAYCLFALGEYSKALKLLEQLGRDFPGDVVTQNLIERVAEAQTARQRGEKEHAASAIEFEAISYGLTRFDLALLDACEYRFVDERSLARGHFTEDDFRFVTIRYDGMRGRQPREKAACLLSLAAMANRNPEAAGEKTVSHYLVRALTFLGETALYDGLHPDTARCYLAEALLLTSTERYVDHPRLLLLATYLTNTPAGVDWAPEGAWNLNVILPLFHQDPAAWRRVTRDMPYYECMFRGVSQTLAREALKHNLPVKDLIEEQLFGEAIGRERLRLRTELAGLRAMAAQPLTQISIQEMTSNLRSLISETRFDLDRQRYQELANSLDGVSSYFNERDYSEKENKVRRILAGLNRLSEEIRKMPTKLSQEDLLGLIGKVETYLNGHFESYAASAQPVVVLDDVLGQDEHAPDPQGVICMKLSISSKPGGAPVEGIDVELAEEDGIVLVEPCHSPEVLRAGEYRELDLLVQPTQELLSEGAFTLRATLKYRLRSGEQATTSHFLLPVRLKSGEEFQEIENPYHLYAGGRPVESPDMFFGRTDLLTRMSDALSSGPVGQCFALYGQKRSGKTSVLKQVFRRLSKPALGVYVSFGEMKQSLPEASVVRMIIDSIGDRLVDDLRIEPNDWPSWEEIKEVPGAALRKAIRQTNSALKVAGWEHPKLVLLIDEFTYIYTCIKQNEIPRDFMHFWKALIDTAAFSAVVVGQDSMPKFIKEFPNDFAVSRQERISYLLESEAHAMAECPIMHNGRSRWRGKALSRLVELTACNPFYMQKACDRLVSHLNDQKAVVITYADVSNAAKTLISGKDSLGESDFDPLITAAEESVALAPRDVYLRLLKVIALQSERTGSASPVDLPELRGFESILQDMQEREVILLDEGGRISIRVGLFAEWLRINRSLIQ